MASKQVHDGADRDTVSKLHRSCVEDSSARRSPLEVRSESRPLQSIRQAESLPGGQGKVKGTAALRRHHPATKHGRRFLRGEDLCNTAGGGRERDAICVSTHASGSTREQTLSDAAKIQMRILQRHRGGHGKKQE